MTGSRMMQPLPRGGNGHVRCSIPFLSLFLSPSPSPSFSDSVCISMVPSSRSHTFSLSFTNSRGKYPCVTSCQNIHIIGAKPFCVPALGGKDQSTSLKFHIADIDLYGIAIEKESGNEHRRDGNLKICHNGRWQRSRNRYRGCLYSNDNIKTR